MKLKIGNMEHGWCDLIDEHGETIAMNILESDARQIVECWNAHEGLIEALNRIHHIRSEPPESDSETMLRVCIHIAAKSLAACGKEKEQ